MIVQMKDEDSANEHLNHSVSVADIKMKTCYTCWWLVVFFLVPSVAPLFSNKFMTFYIPEYAKRYIYLEGKFSYSVQLVLHKGDPAQFDLGATPPISYNLTQPVEFIIKAPEYSYYGIVAIIQSLHFRTNPFSTINNGCRDYIQFSAEEPSAGVEPSPKICGKLDRGDENWQPEGLHGPRTFFNPKGNIKLTAHVQSAVSHQDLNELNSVGAEIVFTAYTSCPETDVGLKTLKSCSSKASLLHACIPSALFCDSKIDCGFAGPEFGLDERQCYFGYLYLAIGIIVVLLVLLFIGAFILWVRFKTKGWSENAETRHSEEEGGGTDTAMMDASMGAF